VIVTAAGISCVIVSRVIVSCVIVSCVIMSCVIMAGVIVSGRDAGVMAMIVRLRMRGLVRTGRMALRVIVRVVTGGGGHRRTFPVQSGLFDWKP